MLRLAKYDLCEFKPLLLPMLAIAHRELRIKSCLWQTSYCQSRCLNWCLLLTFLRTN